MHAALARINYGLPAAPDVLVIAADPAASLRDIAAVDARCAGVLGILDGAERLTRASAFDVVLLEVGEADGDAADELFEMLREGGESGRFASVVVLPFGLVDQAAAQLLTSDSRLLVAPDALDRRVAVAAAMPDRRPLRVSDGGTDTSGASPSELRDEVARIARRLAALAAAEPKMPPGLAANDARVDGAYVRGVIRARRLRDQYFEAELFADPAWDMLLDLTAAKLEGRVVAVSSLCILAAVPPTTALRWIKILTDTGLFVRRADPADKRRIFIALAEEAADAMLCYLAAAQRSGATLM
jgi:hypothetical protein